MAYTDGEVAKQLSKRLERVLVVDGSPASARMLHELLKDLGARYVRVETTTKGALNAVREDEPQIIFTELRGPQLDGLEFTRELRRSDFNGRKVPVVIVTAEATASSIIGARDSGVHEFLRKPFTIKDLVRRLEAVILKSRDWVEAVQYIGPDRRRFNSGEYNGPRKRKSDQPGDSAASRIEQAMRILKAALAALESDPRQAVRSMQAQAADLAAFAQKTGDSALLAAARRLTATLELQVTAGELSRSELEAVCQNLWPWLPADAA